MIQYSRLPAIITLALLLGPGAIFLYSRQSDAASAGASQAELDKLKAAISRPNATPADWMAYAQTLQNMKRYDKAAWAYQRLLTLEPANRPARLNGAVSIALTGNSEDLAAFVKETIACDPKLAVEILHRPETQSFLSTAPFPTLQKEAIAQSMD